MSNLKDSVIIVTCVMVIFSAGVWISTDNITYDVEEDDLGYQYINYTGTIHKAGYKFEFEERLNPENSSIIVNGRAYPQRPDQLNKKIKIRTDRRASEIMDVCRHEVLHYYFPDYRHPDFSKPGVDRRDDPIYKLDDQVDLPVCNEVVATALMRQR